MDGAILEKLYQERLEEKIISHLAQTLQISLDKAMDLYYHSKMADRIAKGEYHIQYLDYKVLTEMLIETELQK